DEAGRDQVEGGVPEGQVGGVHLVGGDLGVIGGQAPGHANRGVDGQHAAAAGQGGAGDSASAGADVEHPGSARRIREVDQLPAEVGDVEEDLLVVLGELVVLAAGLGDRRHRFEP